MQIAFVDHQQWTTIGIGTETVDHLNLATDADCYRFGHRQRLIQTIMASLPLMVDVINA